MMMVGLNNKMNQDHVKTNVSKIRFTFLPINGNSMMLGDKFDLLFALPMLTI